MPMCRGSAMGRSVVRVQLEAIEALADRHAGEARRQTRRVDHLEAGDVLEVRLLVVGDRDVELALLDRHDQVADLLRVARFERLYLDVHRYHLNLEPAGRNDKQVIFSANDPTAQTCPPGLRLLPA